METIMHVNDKLQFHGYDTFSGSDMQLGSSLTGMISTVPFLGSSQTLPLLCNAAEKMKKDEGSHPMLIDSAPSFGHLSYNGFFESNTHASKSRPKQEDAAAAPSSFLKQFPWPDCDAYSEVVLSPLNNFAEQQFGEGEFISPLLSGLDSYKSLSSLSDESRMGNVDSFWFHSNPDSNGFGYLSNAFPTLMGLDQAQYAQEGVNPLSIPLYYNYGTDMGTSSSLQLFPTNSLAFGAESTYKPRIHEFYADSNGQEADTQTTTSNSNESQCRSDLSDQKESRKRPLEITSGHSSCESKRAHLDICGSNGSKKTTYWISCSDDKARTTCSSKNQGFAVINGSTKTKGRQSNANDPQSIAARHRRERISERLKILQDLVPNSSKVDLVTMLEKAINYVKFLQLQVRVLTTDEYWPNLEKNLEKNSSKTSTAKESPPAAEETSEVEQ